jgi:predicted RNase H-like HicB family nuclease
MSIKKVLDKILKGEMVVYWSDDDDSYVVEVLELPGCMADGKTYEEAITNTLVIIREWIETAIELGRDIPKPRGRLIYA